MSDVSIESVLRDVGFRDFNGLMVFAAFPKLAEREKAGAVAAGRKAESEVVIVKDALTHGRIGPETKSFEVVYPAPSRKGSNIVALTDDPRDVGLFALAVLNDLRIEAGFQAPEAECFEEGGVAIHNPWRGDHDWAVDEVLSVWPGLQGPAVRVSDPHTTYGSAFTSHREAFFAAADFPVP